MSWFNLGWSPADTELVKKWHKEKGKHVTFVDETIDDPLADVISWVLGFPISRQLNTPLFSSMPMPKKARKRKPLTNSQRQIIFEIKGSVCSDCGETKGLQIHHADEDPANNSIDNLLVICYVCHKKRHAKKIVVE